MSTIIHNATPHPLARAFRSALSSFYMTNTNLLSKPVRLLALDMDDTLLNEKLEISPANRQAILAAEKRGVHVVLASGRATSSLQKFGEQLGMDKRSAYYISYNGGAIVESDTGHEEWKAMMEPAFLAEIWDLAASMGQDLQTYIPGWILVNHDNEFTLLDSRLSGIPNRVVDRAEFIAEPRYKIVMPGDPEALTPVEAQCKKVLAGRANMFRSKPYFFELLPPEADKGLALARLAGMHGFSRDEVMAMGDSWNDEGMLRWAGVSVAMANAAPEIGSVV